MRRRTGKMISMLLAAAMVFTMNTSVFAEEISGVEEEIEAVEQTADFEEAAEAEICSTNTPVRELLSGNVILTVSDDQLEDIWALSDNTVEETTISDAVYALTEVESNGKKYKLVSENNGKWRLTDGKNTSETISSGNLKMTYGIKDFGKTTSTPVEVKNGKLLGITGNQTIVFTLTLDKINDEKSIKVTPATGEIFVHDPNAGKVVTERVSMGKINGEEVFMEVNYDGACEYRGSKVTTSTHRYDEKEVDGDIDGAVGISVKFTKLSANGIYYPLKGDDYGNYYWKDQTGIVIKKAVIKNGKAVASASADKAPYFTLKASFKNVNDGIIGRDGRNELKKKLKSQKFYFTIEPKKIATSLLSTNKKEADVFYVGKLNPSSDGKKIKAVINWQSWKKKSGSFNDRTMKKGKALKVATYEKDSDSFKKNKQGQIAGDLLWSVNSDGTVNLTGNASYRGVAKNIKPIK
ncbi:hypothetical protein SAMN06296386_10795 [Lachnospiraceae bacterium]|nr:hypothetical protein SAMN06296386_10795 [Lachnospiraceae bacterium]